MLLFAYMQPFYLPQHTSSNVKCCSTRTEIGVCNGPSCKSENGGKPLLSTLNSLCKGTSSVTICATGCLGECGHGPNLSINSSVTPAYIIKSQRTISDLVQLLKTLDIDYNKSVHQSLLHKETGDLLLSQGRCEVAVTEYNAALKLIDGSDDELTVRILCNCSIALVEMKRVKDGLQCANQAVDMDAGYGAAWRCKAMAHGQMREKDMAERAWTIWGKVEGKEKEAKVEIKRLKSWRWF